MATKYIKVPQDVLLLEAVTGRPTGEHISFKDFIIGCLLSDVRWGSSFKQISSGLEVQKAARCANGYMELDAEDWELLRTVAQDPVYTDREGKQVRGYPGLFSHGVMQLAHYIEAVLKASDKKDAE